VKPGELTRIEDTLRRAYDDALAAVQRDDTSPDVSGGILTERPPRGAGRSCGNRRWLAAAAAGAAVAVVALVAGLVPALVTGPVAQNKIRHTPPRPVPAGPMTAYVIGGQKSFRGPNSVIPVNLVSGRVLPPISVGEPGPLSVLMAPNGKTIYVVADDGDVVPVDLATRTAGPPIHIGGDPYGLLISPNGHTGYFMLQYEGVATVNFVTDRPGPVIKIPRAFSFALTPDGKILYVVTSGSSEVVPVDTASLQTLSPIQTEGNNGMSARIAVAPDGKRAYLLNLKKGSVSQLLTPIDTATETALRPIRVAASAVMTPITISPNSRSAYLYTDSGVMAVNLATGKIRWTVSLGDSIWSGQVVESPPWESQTVVSPNSRTVYTHGGDNKGVYRIDAATGRVTLIPMGWVGEDIGFGPDGNLYFLSSIAKGTTLPATWDLWELSRFDPTTGAVLPPISLPDTVDTSFYNLVLGGR
jgi:DNA-binding beta-propeller fold protein YncE